MYFTLCNVYNRRSNINLINLNYKLVKLKRTSVTSRETTVPVSQTVLLEKCLENPVITVPDESIDLIGPPNPISNLRPIVRKRSLHETLLQKRLRGLQDETQAWNETFWSNHNSKFIKERDNYVKSHVKNGNSTLTADEMSEFYKSFLDRNWHIHVWYNYEWYKRNFRLLFLALCVNIELFTGR